MNAARVAEMSDAGEGLLHLTLEMPPELELTFTLPGQYQELAIEGHTARPYAIASGPGRGNRFEFLVRRGFPLADAIGKLQVGDTVHVSNVLGPGFPMETVRGRDLLLVATGTGVAPMRAVIKTVALNRKEFGDVMFYFGGRHGKDFAFEREWLKWESYDIRLVRTVSEPDPDWNGLRGFVQETAPDRFHFARQLLHRKRRFEINADLRRFHCAERCS